MAESLHPAVSPPFPIPHGSAVVLSQHRLSIRGGLPDICPFIRAVSVLPRSYRAYGAKSQDPSQILDGLIDLLPPTWRRDRDAYCPFQPTLDLFFLSPCGILPTAVTTRKFTACPSAGPLLWRFERAALLPRLIPQTRPIWVLTLFQGLLPALRTCKYCPWV